DQRSRQCGSGSCAPFRGLCLSQRSLPPTALECLNRALSLYHRVGGWGVHYGLPGSRLQGQGLGTSLSAVVADCIRISPLRPVALALSPRPSRTVLRSDDDATPDVADGDFRICLRVVLDGGSPARTVVRLSPGFRGMVAEHQRFPGHSLSGFYIG